MSLNNVDKRKLAIYEFIFGKGEYDENTYDSVEDAAEAEVEETHWSSFECDGGEYLVLTESEATERATDNLKDLFDDVGVFGLSDYTTHWVLDNAIDEKWFEEAMSESNRSYAEDIQSEDSNDDDMYVNRLHEEMCDRRVLEPLDLPEEPQEDDYDDVDEETGMKDMTKYDEDHEEWEKECERLREEMIRDVENSIDEFVEEMNGDYTSGVEWYKDHFGIEELSETVKRNNLVDDDAVAEMIIDTDGIGHVLASWDGEEYEFDGYNIYRVG